MGIHNNTDIYSIVENKSLIGDTHARVAHDRDTHARDTDYIERALLIVLST